MVKLNTKKILQQPGGDSKTAAGYVYLEFQWKSSAGDTLKIDKIMRNSDASGWIAWKIVYENCYQRTPFIIIFSSELLEEFLRPKETIHSAGEGIFPDI